MNVQTLEKMRKLRLFGMYRAFKTNVETEIGGNYTPDEIVAHLIDAEWDDKQNRQVEQKIKNAKFRYKADLEDLHYYEDRNIDKNQIMRFADCSFIDKAECILITGSTGVGKSYIASAIGYQACSLGYKVMYHSVPKLFSKLKMSKADGSYPKDVGRIERQQLLILDDFGIQPYNGVKPLALA